MITPGWVKRQIEALLTQFCARSGNAAWIGIADRIHFSRPAGGPARPWRMGGGFASFAGLDINEGFVWEPEDPAAQPELWLNPAKQGYRPIFERFAQRRLGASGLGGLGLDVDHVFPKATAIASTIRYVRMLAIPSGGNRAAGRTVEKHMVAGAREAPRAKMTRMATYVSIGKAAGFEGWTSLPDSDDASSNMEAVRALFLHLRGMGLRADVLTALDMRLTAHRLTSLR